MYVVRKFGLHYGGEVMEIHWVDSKVVFGHVKFIICRVERTLQVTSN